MSVLIASPVCGHTCDPEDPLWYAEPYFDEIYNYVSARRPTTYLKRDQAVRSHVWRSLAERRHIVHVLVGHGRPDVYTGYMSDRVYWIDMTADGFDTSWIRGATILALSCDTARALGPWMVRQGVTHYLGWTEAFAFTVEIGVRRSLGSPDTYFLDPVARAFARCASGEITPEQAYAEIYSAYTSYIRDPSIPMRYKSLLRHDRDSMVLLTTAILAREPHVIGGLASLAASAILMFLARR